MKNSRQFALIITMILFGFTVMISCTHKTDAVPDVSFSKAIMPILTTSCAISSACHSGDKNTGDNMNFDSSAAYNTMIAKQLIKPANATASLLYVEVSSGIMPKAPYQSLSADQINLILNWIKQGGKNN